MSDPAKYRTREEVQKMRSERDPIDTLRKKLIDTFNTTEEALKQIDRAVKNEISEAADFAISSEEPDIKELWTDIYATT
jgi:pyruvate dehydrogenase E1 component alpha subunit